MRSNNPQRTGTKFTARKMRVNEPLNLSRIRALCFDVDGTLRDTDDQFVMNLVHLLTPFRFLFSNGDPQPFARRIVMATETPANLVYRIMDQLGIYDELNKIGKAITHIGLGETNTPFQLVQGVRGMLQACWSSFPLGIVSARGKRSTEKFLTRFDLGGYFACLATAQTTDRTKPHPDPLYWAAAQMDVNPEACLMIGDTTVDITAARRAGAQSIGVLCGFGTKEELLDAGANLILERTSDLTKILFPPQDVREA